WDERRFAEFVVAPGNAEQPEIVHGEEDHVGTEEGDPEMKLPEYIVRHPPGDLGVPMIDRSHHNEDGRYPHHHVEMRDDEHGIGKRDVHDNVAEEETCEPAVDKGDDEGESEQHRRRQMNVAAP